MTIISTCTWADLMKMSPFHGNFSQIKMFIHETHVYCHSTGSLLAPTLFLEVTGSLMIVLLWCWWIKEIRSSVHLWQRLNIKGHIWVCSNKSWRKTRSPWIACLSFIAPSGVKSMCLYLSLVNGWMLTLAVVADDQFCRSDVKDGSFRHLCLPHWTRHEFLTWCVMPWDN